jgi:hypothetical protein
VAAALLFGHVPLVNETLYLGMLSVAAMVLLRRVIQQSMRSKRKFTGGLIGVLGGLIALGSIGVQEQVCRMSGRHYSLYQLVFFGCLLGMSGIYLTL